MNSTATPYLDELVKSNLLLKKEAQAISRLPDALQEKAMEQAEAQRIQAIDQIVSDLLNPQPVSQPPAAGPSHGLADAAMKDVLNKFLPGASHVTWEIREQITRAWESGKTKTVIKWVFVLWLLSIAWAPLWWLIKMPYRVNRHFWTHHASAVVSTPVQVVEAPPVLPPQTVNVGATQNVGNTQTAAKGSLLTDTSHRSSGIPAAPVTPPVVVQHAAPPAPKPGFMTSFAKNLVGNGDALVNRVVPIKPLAEGINTTKNAAIKANAETQNAQPETAVMPIPTGLSAKNVSPSKIQLSWAALGSGVTYSLYSSKSQDMADAKKENTHPVQHTTVTWWSDTGPGTYYLAITASDAAGHESLYSDPMEVTVR